LNNRPAADKKRVASKKNIIWGDQQHAKSRKQINKKKLQKRQ
jgi:hypothetical protein